MHRAQATASCAKDQNMLAYWSPQDAQHLAQQQKGLLRAAYQMLRPGGTLVYSTCSLSLEENEEVLLGLLRRYKEDVAILPIAEFEGPPLPDALAAQFPAEFARCVRVWPHHHDTEGAFVARLSKRAPTPSLGDAPAWATSTTDPAAAESRHAIEGRWSGTLPCPSDQIFTLSNRHLCRQPALGPAHPRASALLRPRRHEGGPPPQRVPLPKSQQTVALWGHLMQGPSIELNWSQLQDLVRRVVRSTATHPRASRAKFSAAFGPWTVCRAIAKEEGRLIEGMLPRALFRAQPSLI